MAEQNLLESIALVTIEQGERLKTIETLLFDIKNSIFNTKTKESSKIEKAFLDYFSKDKKSSKINKKDFFEQLDTIMITLLGAGEDINDEFKEGLYKELYDRI